MLITAENRLVKLSSCFEKFFGIFFLLNNIKFVFVFEKRILKFIQKRIMSMFGQLYQAVNVLEKILVHIVHRNARK